MWDISYTNTDPHSKHEEELLSMITIEATKHMINLFECQKKWQTEPINSVYIAMYLDLVSTLYKMD